MQLRWYRMSAPFMELDRTVFFLSSPLPHMENFHNLFLWSGLKPKKFLVSVDAVVGLATTLADKHMAIVLQNYVLVRRLQRLKTPVTYMTGVNPLSLVWLVPPTDPIHPHHEFTLNPALDIFRSRFQQVNTPLHLLLKADSSLEGNVADDKADPSACHQFSHFWGTAGSMDHQQAFRQLDIL